MIISNTKQATREELIDRIKELEQTNLELLTRLKADSLLARDKWWIKKIENKIEELSGMEEIADIEREVYNRAEFAIETLLEVLGGIE